MYSLLNTLLKPQNPITGLDEFYYVRENMYVVPVPKIGGAPTAIENLFDPALLKTVLNGKTFDLTGKQKDVSKYYGKAIFAEHVVKKNRATINFAGFQPLLNALVHVQLDYAARLAAMPPPLAPIIPAPVAPAPLGGP